MELGNRAAAWDAENRRQAQLALMATIEKAQKQDQMIWGAVVGTLAHAFRSVNWQEMKPADYVRVLTAAIEGRRKALGVPTEVEEVRHKFGAITGDDVQAVAMDLDIARFAASPDMHAAVSLILDKYEYMPESARGEWASCRSRVAKRAPARRAAVPWCHRGRGHRDRGPGRRRPSINMSEPGCSWDEVRRTAATFSLRWALPFLRGERPFVTAKLRGQRYRGEIGRRRSYAMRSGIADGPSADTLHGFRCFGLI